MQELPKQYRPVEHEDRIFERWMASRAFHADPAPVLSGEKPPYCVLIPPPNVTAALHLGHALNNTIQDILVRAHRMMGFETLWMPGTDHAGIATQAVVEKRLKKDENTTRQRLGREKFIEKVQAFKDEYEATITNQLKKMGCSCDWERQRFTMDPICARAVREAFFRLFRDGLIYRGKRLVNWDPALQTAIADDEIENIEIDGAFYYLRYPLVHPTGARTSGEVKHGDAAPDDAVPVSWGELARRGYRGAEQHEADEAAYVTVATTRPETYLGDTAVAISPKDPRAKALRGLFVELPLVGRLIPVIEDDYVVLPSAKGPYGSALGLRESDEPEDAKAAFATGFLKVTPAHDPNDYELGRKHGLPMINIMAPDASISDKHGWTDVGDAHLFVGKKREDARKLVVKEFEARGLLEQVKPYRHTVGHSDRSKAAIEPYLSDQWYVRVTDDRLAGAANRALVEDQRSAASVGTSSARAGTSAPQAGTGAASAKMAATQAGTGATQAGTSAAPRQEVRPQAGTSATSAGTGATQAGTTDGGRQELGRQAAANPTQAAMVDGGRRTIRTEAATDHSGVGSLSTGAGAINGGRRTLRRGSNSAHGAADAGDGSLRFHPARYSRTYENWHDNIRDWCISRQLWWGHRIPVWSVTPRAQFGESHPEKGHAAYEDFGSAVAGACAQLCSDGEPNVYTRYDSINQTTHVCARDEAAEIALNRFSQWLAEGADSSALAGVFPTEPARAGAKELATVIAQLGRDPDVLDTWFSSALWPISTMGWPESTDTLRAFNPSSTLCTAREIITLWVSRMVMFNRYFMAEGTGHQALGTGESQSSPVPSAQSPVPPGSGPVPFFDVFIHSVIQDGEGRKMSKTLGNGVDPLDIIATHGADAMRFTLCHMTTQTQDVRLPVKKDSASGKNTSEKFDLGRNFANKLWNAGRFALGILGDGTTPGLSESSSEGPDRDSTSARRNNDPGLRPRAASVPASLSLADRWMLSRLATAVEACNRALAEFQFADYATIMYDLLWRDFCDWYLEAIKPTVAGDAQQRAVLAHTLDSILRLLHPVMPYVTEAIYEQSKGIVTQPVAGIELAGARKDGLLATAGWPRVAASLRDEKAEREFEELREFITAVREVRAQHKVSPKRRITLHAPAGTAMLRDAGNVTMVKTLAGVETVTEAVPAGASVSFNMGSTEFRVSDLADAGDAGAMDSGAEKARLEKLVADLDKSIATLEGRLANPGYALKAPPHMVEQTKGQLEKAKAERAAAAATLGGLG